MSFRKAFLAFIACGAMLAASSCIDRGGEDLIVNITTSVGEDGIEFDMNAQDTTFTLTSNCDWTVEMEVENPWEDEAEVFEQNPWLTVTPTSAKASDQPVSVTVTAEANISDADEITYDRAVIVYFRTDREQFASVRVFQAGKERKPNAADTISISELRQMAPASQDSVVTITDPLIIKGVVVSSRDPQTVSNNNIFVQDGTGPHSGLLVYSSAFTSCNFGDVVEITVTDGTLEYYFGQLELKPASPDDLVVVDKVENPEAAEIEGASLVNGDYEGQYVKMYAQVVQGDLEKTMGDKPSIETEDGSSFLMYSRSNTPWAGEEVPQGAGTVYGLVGSHNGVYQLVPSRATDFEGMTESRFTGRPAVTTGEGQLSEDKSSMTVTGEYTYAGEASDVTEVGVAYKLVDAEEYTKVKAEKVESPFTVTIPLETGAYEYYAYVMIGEREYQGETLTVTTEETAVSVAELVAAILDGTIEDDAPLATLGAYLEGIVAAGNQSANYNGKYALVDGTGEEATGIVLYGMYDVVLNPGDHVRISLANASFDNYNNLREVKFKDGIDINAEVEVLKSGVGYTIPELTVAELLSGDWQGQYVKVKGVRSASDSLVAWTDSGNSTNRTFTDGTDEFQVRTQYNAEWAEEGIDPEVTADFGCVVEVYYENVQVYAATYDDIKAFSVPAGDEPEDPDVPVGDSTATVEVAEVVAAILDGTISDGGSFSSLGGFMEGIVAGGNEGENYYRKYAIVDGTGEEGTGIVVYGINDEYKVGDRVKISLSNAKYDDYSGLREMTFDGNPEIEVLESGVNFNTPQLSVSELNAGEWQGMYVTVKNVTSDEEVSNPWVADGKTTSRYFTDGTESFVVRTTSYALWADEYVNIDATGDLSGVVEIYNGRAQVYAIRYSDIATFSTDAPEIPEEPENPVIEGTAGDGNYTSSIDLTQPSAEGGQNSSSSVFIIDGNEYPAMKLGTGSSFGAYSFNLGKTGSCALTMYAVAWKNGETNVLVKISGGGTINGAEQVELACAANAGLTSNSPFTITFGDKDFYTMNIEGATENTVITVTTEGMQDNRAGFTGVNVK